MASPRDKATSTGDRMLQGGWSKLVLVGGGGWLVKYEQSCVHKSQQKALLLGAHADKGGPLCQEFHTSQTAAPRQRAPAQPGGVAPTTHKGLLRPYGTSECATSSRSALLLGMSGITVTTALERPAR